MIFLSILLLIGATAPMNALTTTKPSLEFKEYKNNGFLDTQFFKTMQELFQPDIFIETGTYNAGTTMNAAPYFKAIHTSEIHPKMYSDCCNKLRHLSHITVYHESSDETFKKILPTMKGKALFWLDAHFCGDGTGLSFDDESHPEAITAIRRELKIIKEYSNAETESIILVDDLRGFGAIVDETNYPACWAYPSVQEVQSLLLEINPNFAFVMLKDTLLAYDKKYTPTISPVAQACTKTRLYNGSSLSDEELLLQEQIIMHAQGTEKAAIKELYTMTTDYKDPLFIYDLWYGLTCLGDKKYNEAHKVLSQVSHRREHLNQRRQPSTKEVVYNHPRIQMYLDSCATNITA